MMYIGSDLRKPLSATLRPSHAAPLPATPAPPPQPLTRAYRAPRAPPQGDPPPRMRKRAHTRTRATRRARDTPQHHHCQYPRTRFAAPQLSRVPPTPLLLLRFSLVRELRRTQSTADVKCITPSRSKAKPGQNNHHPRSDTLFAHQSPYVASRKPRRHEYSGADLRISVSPQRSFRLLSATETL